MSSHRDLAERILQLRHHIAQEAAEDVDMIPVFNDAVLRRWGRILRMLRGCQRLYYSRHTVILSFRSSEYEMLL